MEGPFAIAVATAVDDCFRHLGRDAVYTADGGEPVTVRVVAKRPDEIVGLGETRIHAGTALFDVRVSEIAEPRPGDRLSVGGEDYLVQGEAGRRYRTPDLDTGGLTGMKLTATMVGSLKADMQAELRRIERAVPDGVKSRRRRAQGEPAQAGGRRRSRGAAVTHLARQDLCQQGPRRRKPGLVEGAADRVGLR